MRGSVGAVRGVGAVVLALAAWPGAGVSQAPEPAVDRRMAITIDDLPVISRTRSDAAFQADVTRGILAALERHGVRSVGFVNEDKLERDGRVDDARVALLRRWLDAGQELGNHTYDHPDLHRIDAAAFVAAIGRGERVTRGLAAEAGVPFRWFRHPFLHTGRDSTTRAAVEGWLAEHGYRVAPVTVDNYDYQFALAYDVSMARGDTATAARVVATYLDYMESVVAFYEAQSRALQGREIPQVLDGIACQCGCAELEGMREQLAALKTMPLCSPPTHGWATLERELRSEGLIRESGSGWAWARRGAPGAAPGGPGGRPPRHLAPSPPPGGAFLSEPGGRFRDSSGPRA